MILQGLGDNFGKGEDSGTSMHILCDSIGILAHRCTSCATVLGVWHIDAHTGRYTVQLGPYTVQAGRYTVQLGRYTVQLGPYTVQPGPVYRPAWAAYRPAWTVYRPA